MADNEGLRLVLNAMAGGYDLKIKVNGVDLGSLKPLGPGFSTVALQLYGANKSLKNNVKAEDANFFCLREGENGMEAFFDLVEPDKVGPLGLRITLVSPSIGPAKPVLDFQQGEEQSGRFHVMFVFYWEMADDFKKVITNGGLHLKREGQSHGFIFDGAVPASRPFEETAGAN